MRMDGTAEDWSHSGASPKQVSSPMQEDIYQTNGPPGESVIYILDIESS